MKFSAPAPADQGVQTQPGADARVPPAIALRVPTGRRMLTLHRGPLALRLDVRSAAVAFVAALLALAVAFVSLAWGDVVVPFKDVLASFFGQAGRKATVVVQEWRLGRVELALLFGFALGMSGALFQSLTRNPLGSPDVIGFSSGAYTGALVLMLFTSAGPLLVSLGSLASGLVVALVVLALASRDGTTGFRLIVVGIGVGAMLASLNTYLLLAAERNVALSAAVWGAGSLNSIATGIVAPAAGCIAVFSMAAFALQRRARVMEQGEELALSLGIDTRRVRLGMVVAGVGLVAVATAAAGPIAFVALVAPQIAGRLTRREELDLLPAGCLGALLLVVSDVLARVAFPPYQLPVGIVTVCLGGAYLLFLLVKEARR